MVTTGPAPVYVDAPPVTPLGLGLLSVSGVDENPPDHFEFGVEYEPEDCGPAYDQDGVCGTPVVFDFTAADAGGVALVQGGSFTIYKPFRCAPLGRTDHQARALEGLRLGEQRAVETVVATLLPLGLGAVDLTPTAGTAIDMADAVALIEQYSSSHYGGVATIHVARGVASTMVTRGILEKVDQGTVHLETKLGTRVAAGAGYDKLHGPPVGNGSGTTPGSGPTATSAWVYVTGTVMQYRRPPRAGEPFLDNTPAGVRNRLTVIAQRPYVVTWECITAAVLVKTPYAVPNGASTAPASGGSA